MQKVPLPQTNNPRVVIIGGGFGGIELAKKLKKKSVQVVMIDRNNFHTFQPLLYQVATAGLEPDSIAYPLRKIFKRQSNFHFRMAEAQQIIPEENKLLTSIGEIRYDYLVMATGSTTNFFGLKEIEQNSMPMKSVTEALDLRSLLLQNFEKALLAKSVEEREALMNVVVVGGGPTGVETAGALGELKENVLPQDYPELDVRQMQIHLIEASKNLLNGMSEVSGKKAVKFLKKFDVQVWLNTAVKHYDGEMVYTNTEHQIPTNTLIWSAGVKGAVVEGIDETVIGRGNRILVNEFNQVKGYSNVFAVGDVAAMLTEKTPKGHPMVAPVAIQQGHLLAKNLDNLLQSKTLKAFQYKDKGSMATVGRNRAVVEVGKFKSQGFFAWFMWMAVHLMSLVGFRNKLVTFVNWMWSYFNYDKGIRLIIRPFERKKKTASDKIEEILS
ncbi:MAG: NAD(P)/FAD-dependent oxidoreductase [Chitinophagales bacterium]